MLLQRLPQQPRRDACAVPFSLQRKIISLRDTEPPGKLGPRIVDRRTRRDAQLRRDLIGKNWIRSEKLDLSFLRQRSDRRILRVFHREAERRIETEAEGEWLVLWFPGRKSLGNELPFVLRVKVCSRNRWVDGGLECDRVQAERKVRAFELRDASRIMIYG